MLGVFFNLVKRPFPFKPQRENAKTKDLTKPVKPVDGSEIPRSPVDVVNIPSFTRFYRSKWWFHGFSEPSTVQNAEPLISIARVLHLSKHIASRCGAATGGVATCHFLAIPSGFK